MLFLTCTINVVKNSLIINQTLIKKQINQKINLKKANFVDFNFYKNHILFSLIGTFKNIIEIYNKKWNIKEYIT